MCYELHHKCQYCYLEYFCALDNNICPSLNYDADRLMCDECRDRIESLADIVTFDEIRKKYVITEGLK